jgi:hypothetical protein
VKAAVASASLRSDGLIEKVPFNYTPSGRVISVIKVIRVIKVIKVMKII